MKLGIRFPSPQEKLAREVAELRDLAADERLEAMLELADLCEALLEASPHRARQLALVDARERSEHERWKELIRRHAR